MDGSDDIVLQRRPTMPLTASSKTGGISPWRSAPVGLSLRPCAPRTLSGPTGRCFPRGDLPLRRVWRASKGCADAPMAHALHLAQHNGPCSSSHLSCPARGRRAWEEWYPSVPGARGTTRGGGAAPCRAPSPRLAPVAPRRQHAPPAAQLGPPLVALPCLHAWSQLAREQPRAAALERASSWLRSYGWRVVVAYSFRRLRGFARRCARSAARRAPSAIAPRRRAG